jgi:hypothetical protein
MTLTCDVAMARAVRVLADLQLSNQVRLTVTSSLPLIRAGCWGNVAAVPRPPVCAVPSLLCCCGAVQLEMKAVHDRTARAEEDLHAAQVMGVPLPLCVPTCACVCVCACGVPRPSCVRLRGRGCVVVAAVLLSPSTSVGPAAGGDRERPALRVLHRPGGDGSCHRQERREHCSCSRDRCGWRWGRRLRCHCRHVTVAASRALQACLASSLIRTSTSCASAATTRRW